MSVKWAELSDAEKRTLVGLMRSHGVASGDPEREIVNLEGGQTISLLNERESTAAAIEMFSAVQMALELRRRRIA